MIHMDMPNERDALTSPWTMYIKTNQNVVGFLSGIGLEPRYRHGSEQPHLHPDETPHY